MRGCARETRLSPLRRRQPSVWLHETLLLRDANIKESRLFMYILNNSDILFDSGRFMWVNAYFGASIHLILFFVSILGKQNRKKVWNLRKALSLCTIKICRFEIIDVVKYVYCIKHAYKFFLW